MICAIFAPLLAPDDPRQGILRDSNIPPIFMEGCSSEHWLGTDRQGRDILSCVIFGARISMIIAVIVVIGGILGGGPAIHPSLGDNGGRWQGIPGHRTVAELYTRRRDIPGGDVVQFPGRLAA